MSYILEALKKSEQERRRGEIPEISRFEGETTSREQRFKLWPIISIVLVLINLGVLLVWAPWSSNERVPVAQEQQNIKSVDAAVEQPIVQQNPQQIQQLSPKSPVQQPKSAIIKQPVVENAIPSQEPRQQVVDQPISKPKAILKPEPVAVKRAAAAQEEPEIIRPSRDVARQAAPSASTPRTSYLPQLQELPQSFQQRIPDMSFSSHMYSSEPRFRSIIINGRRLKEGQFLSDEIQVIEITGKGVVLGLEGTVFEVDILGQWVN